ncbi:CsbD family protein [Bdellovibrio sp. HCB288]|uniref:CsbD family protein n=1 Tax=Bdellovibrio sp. HCB288 TaxID=3394355 RepID=UPI0039B418A0
MNKETLSGDWKILKGKIKEAWGRLTDDDIDKMEGNLDKLEGQIEKTYGLSKEEATKKFNEFKDSLNSPESDQRLSEDRRRTSLDSDINPDRSERH